MSDIIQELKQKFDSFLEFLKGIKKIDQFLAIFLLTLWVIFIFGYFIPANYVFEGNLIVESLNFTYNGNNDKLFLQNIDNIKHIDLQGKLEQPIALSGKFSIDNDIDLQKKLDNIKTLTIELPFPESRFIVIEKNNLDITELSLNNLYIQPKTKINELNYDASNNILSICLTTINDTLGSCLSPQNIEPSASPIGKLKLVLGEKPLEIQLQQVNIPELNIKSERDNPEELNLQFTPNNNEPINLSLLSPNRLFITVPKLEKNNNSADWFRKDIDVKNVQFIRYENTEKVNDEIETSTILKGQIRLGKDKLELENNQFLIINSPELGIKKIRSLKINSESPQGIETFIIGESQGIAVGLYPDFPVETIKPNLLSKLPSEAISAIIGFITALTAILVPSLFPKPPNN